MVLVAPGCVAVGHHDHAATQGARVTGRGLAAHVRDRARDQHSADVPRRQQRRKRAVAREERTGGGILGQQVTGMHLELFPEPAGQRPVWPALVVDHPGTDAQELGRPPRRAGS